MHTALTLPERSRKPRSAGLTMVIDGGLPIRLFRDVIASYGPHIDLVKFGWGTAVVTPCLREKLTCLREAGIGYFFGGTLFEKHVAQGEFDAYRQLCHDHGCRYVEVSNGTVPLEESDKAHYVSVLAEEFTVLSEVGSKTTEGNNRLTPRDWARQIRTDLAHGAHLVITESRESGTTGFANPSGEVREEVLDAILAAGVDPALLLFEAPTKALQTELILRFGANVNLGNIAPSDVVGVETLRLGLRSDTLLDLARAVPAKIAV
ncbi:MAG: phosphosulfolactate synthase [Mycobacteriaceae bacterium]